MIKVNILWNIQETGGGGNQFLRTLKRYFIEKDIYEEDPQKADVVLVNSKDRLEEATLIKKSVGNKIVHRIDGIFSLYRGEHEGYNDNKVYDFARNYADGIIFQSQWSREVSKKNGMSNHPKETVILNCADNKYFKNEPDKRTKRDKIRLVTSSWSSNIKKGFDIYRWLDNNLDFCKFEYLFIGRSPCDFNNIKKMGILSSEKVTDILQDSDIFITATRDDTCSNSLIEALSCGLPAVVLNSGGSSEILKEGGGLFESEGDVLEKIDMVKSNLDMYRNRIEINNIGVVGKLYCDFMEELKCTK